MTAAEVAPRVRDGSNRFWTGEPDARFRHSSSKFGPSLKAEQPPQVIETVDMPVERRLGHPCPLRYLFERESIETSRVDDVSGDGDHRFLVQSCR